MAKRNLIDELGDLQLQIERLQDEADVLRDKVIASVDAGESFGKHYEAMVIRSFRKVLPIDEARTKLLALDCGRWIKAHTRLRPTTTLVVNPIDFD